MSTHTQQKVSYLMNKGFTLIEILISLVILSMIAVISSNILQSSLELERSSTSRLAEVRNLNFSSVIIRRDIRQIVNTNLRDGFGNSIDGTFSGNNITKKFFFNTKVNSISNEVSPIKRVEYELIDDKFTRKQFFSSNPYNLDEYISSNVIEGVSEIEILFLNENQWYSSWPIDQNTSNKIPKLIKLEFIQNNKKYLWIIEPNIDYEVQK